VDEVDLGTVLAIAALMVTCVGYLSRQMNRVDDRLTARIDGVESRLTAHIDGVESNLGSRIDQLTERYIAHLERHSH
jgi:hypothetical protein